MLKEFEKPFSFDKDSHCDYCHKVIKAGENVYYADGGHACSLDHAKKAANVADAAFSAFLCNHPELNP